MGDCLDFLRSELVYTFEVEQLVIFTHVKGFRLLTFVFSEKGADPKSGWKHVVLASSGENLVFFARFSSKHVVIW